MNTNEPQPPTESAPSSCSAIIAAAERMDWGQVVVNGGPPCFHVCEDGRFCGRAQRWVGHKPMASGHVIDHDFVSLVDLLRLASGDDTPGDVIAAYPDGSVILDDGLQIWNPMRVVEFIAKGGRLQ